MHASAWRVHIRRVTSMSTNERQDLPSHVLFWKATLTNNNQHRLGDIYCGLPHLLSHLHITQCRQFVLSTSPMPFIQQPTDVGCGQLALLITCTILNKLRSWTSQIFYGFWTSLHCLQKQNTRITLSMQTIVRRHRVRPLHFFQINNQPTSDLAFTLLLMPVNKQFYNIAWLHPIWHAHKS